MSEGIKDEAPSSADTGFDFHNLKKNILVMDDEPTARNATLRALHACGFDASAAENGTETIERYVQATETGCPFYAVIMDVYAPNGAGAAETGRRLLNIDPNAKIIVMSGDRTCREMTNYEQFGFKNSLAKPFSLVSLKAVLMSV